MEQLPELPPLPMEASSEAPAQQALPALPELPVEKPGFLKKLEDFGSGAMEGSLTYTAKLLSLAERGLRLGGEATTVPRAVEYWAERNKDGSGYTTAGKIASEVLTTAPVPFGAVGKAASLAKELAPTGLKTLAKYGASAGTGAGLLAGMETQRYNPDNPNELLNTQAAGEALSSPLSYALPAIGTKVSTWMGASRALGEAKEQFPNIMARDIKEPGITKSLSQAVFDAPAAITGWGKRVSQVENVGNDLRKFVTTVAGSPEFKNSIDYVELAGTKVRNALQGLEAGEDMLWNAPFKYKPIMDVQAVKDEAINAIDALKGTGIPSEALSIKQLQNSLRKGPMTVEDAKRLMSQIGKASVNARNADNAGAGVELSGQLKQFKDNILNHIQTSLSPDDMKAFSAAREYTAKKYATYEAAPMLQKAIGNEAASQKLINSLISEGGVLPPKKVALGVMSQEGRQSVDAAKIAKAVEDSDTAGRINLDTFLKKTAEYTQTPKILSNDSYTALQGLNKYLSSVNEASRNKWAKPLGALGIAAAGAGAATGIPAAAIIPLVSYGAAAFVANHSPLKTLLHAATKNLPTETYNAVSKAIEKNLTRGGYIVTQDGLLKHKDDNEE